MKNKTLLMIVAILIIAISAVAQVKGTFTDSRDGKTYKTVKIGTQTWMAENLAYKPSSGNYWVFDNIQDNLAKYGYLYDKNTAKKTCPAGWHLPSYQEWTTLFKYLGGEEVAGSKMKSANEWNEDNNATNQSGFSALPGGYRGNGEFNRFGTVGSWWASTDNDCSKEEFFITSWDGTISSGCLSGGFILLYDDNKGIGPGLSVRCIKD